MYRADIKLIDIFYQYQEKLLNNYHYLLQLLRHKTTVMAKAESRLLEVTGPINETVPSSRSCSIQAIITVLTISEYSETLDLRYSPA